MARIATILFASPISLLLVLTACGADGGSAMNSALPPAGPAPTTITPTGLSSSGSFSDSMQSGNFVSIAQSDVFSATPSGSTTTYSHNYSNASNVYISYDASSNTYSFNFTSNNKPASVSINSNIAQSGNVTTITSNGYPDPTEVNFNTSSCSTGGCYGNNGLVTHTGGSGFVYSYVAFAQAESYSQGAVGNSGYTIYQAVFGMPTAVAAVPQTGTASYALDLFGTYAGTGTGSVNFGSGTYSFSGSISPTGITSGTFSSTGTLTSAGNGFAGTINLTILQELSPSEGSSTTKYSGQLGGMFFGPQAQELGGTFIAPAVSQTITPSGSNPPPLSSIQPVYGAILGHK